jgi:hypothetical protein
MRKQECGHVTKHHCKRCNKCFACCLGHRVGAFAVWYYGVIVRGPFATKRLAERAIKQIKLDCSCDYQSLRIAVYDPAADAQREGWTHPSVLAMAGPKVDGT